MSRDIKLSVPDLGKEELKNVTEVLESGWLAPGKFNNLLENQFIDLIGSKYALSMNSCASALEIAIKAHGIKGEVIVPFAPYSESLRLPSLSPTCKMFQWYPGRW